MIDHDHFKECKFEAYQPLLFEADHVQFVVTTKSSRWIVTPINSDIVRMMSYSGYYVITYGFCYTRIQIKKIDIDDYAPGRPLWIPHSHFKAKLPAGDLITATDNPDFECEVKMVGAKQPYNKFNIDISTSQGMTNFCVRLTYDGIII